MKLEDQMLHLLETGQTPQQSAAEQGMLGLLEANAPPEQAPAETPSPAPAAIDYGPASQVARGATLGLFDRGLAFARSLRSGLPYDTELSHLGIERQKYEEANPLASGVAEFAGSAIPTVAAMTPVGRAVRAGGAALGLPSALRGLARVGAEGATAGATLYPLSNEKSLADAAVHGGEAGLLFGPLGALLAAPLRANISPETAQAASAWLRQGQTVYPSQLKGGPAAARLFGSAPNETQVNDLTRGVARSFGMDADTITSEMIRGPQGALTHAGAIIEDAALSSKGIPATDPTFVGNINQLLQRAAQEYGGKDTDGYRRVLSLFEPIVEAARTGAISGKSYANLTQKGSPIWNASSRTSPIRQFAVELKSALDEALERNNPVQAKQIAEGRHAYHNALIAEDVIDAHGKVDPKALARRVESNAGYGSTYRASAKAGAAGALADIGALAEGAGQFLGERGQSPTAWAYRHPFMTAAGVLGGERAVEALSVPLAHEAATHPMMAALGAAGAGLYGLGGAAMSNPYTGPAYARMLLSGIDPAAAAARLPVPAGYNAYFGGQQ